MALQSNHEFLPAEVARAVFPTAFRGYDQEAVRRYLTRLAESLEHQLDLRGLEALQDHAPNQDRIEELEAEVLELQEQIGSLESDLSEAVALAEAATSESPALDEQQAIAWLGKETARVLETARSAAADLTAKAETESETMRAEAASELAAAREQAETVRAEADAEAESRVATLTAEAEKRAASLVADAEARAGVLTAEAEEQAETLRADAETKAEQVTSAAEAKAQEATTAADALATEVTEAAQAEADAKTAAAASVLGEAEATAAAMEADARSRADQIIELAEERRRLLVTGLVEKRRRCEQEIRHLASARSELHEALREAQDNLDSVIADLGVAAPSAEGQAAVDTDSESEATEGDLADEVEALLAGLDADLPEPVTSRADAAPQPAHEATRSGESTSTGDETRPAEEPTEEIEAVALPDKGAGGRTNRTKATPKKRPSKKAPAKKAPAGKTPAEKVSPNKSESTESASTEVALAEDSSEKVASLVEGFTTIDVLAHTSIDEPVDEDDTDLSPMGPEPLESVRPAIDPALLVPLVEVPDDPAERITTVAARTGSGVPDGRRGDFALEEPSVERLPSWFAARDTATSRGGPNVRRHLRRALNDDQSDVMDRLRNGRGPISVEDLPPAAEQLERFVGPVRRALIDVVRAGAQAGGGAEVAEHVVANLCHQLAAHLVDQLRLPTIAIVAEANHDDRELILEPIRALYRDLRNIQMPDLADDALHEAFAIGLYEAIEPGSSLRWEVDPRTDPDPVCDINSNRHDLTKGELFPSGHLRPLSLPGCRCLVVGTGTSDTD